MAEYKEDLEAEGCANNLSVLPLFEGIDHFWYLLRNVTHIVKVLISERRFGKEHLISKEIMQWLSHIGM